MPCRSDGTLARPPEHELHASVRHNGAGFLLVSGLASALAMIVCTMIQDGASDATYQPAPACCCLPPNDAATCVFFACNPRSVDLSGTSVHSGAQMCALAASRGCVVYRPLRLATAVALEALGCSVSHCPRVRERERERTWCSSANPCNANASAASCHREFV